MDDTSRIESCIYCASDEARYDDAAIATLEAELRELRRAKWNWDEARRIAAKYGDRPPFVAELRRELHIFVAGDGDAEWEQKAATTPR